MKFPYPFLFAVFCLAFFLFPAVFTAAQSAGNVEVSFVYTAQRGFASNQFAVWVEDAQGRYVKTLFATKYTAKGGWKKRDQSIPLWVKQSGLAEMTKAQVDAVSGSTPKTGTLRYVWDGKNQAGRDAGAGNYKIYVEATLRDENRVLYIADVQLGGTGTVRPQPGYSGNSSAERGMINQVIINVRP